jgi:membrane protease YdiL (CAAX protease family)
MAVLLGLFIVFLVSWFILRRVFHEPLEVIGLAPTRRRLRELLVGMLFMATIGFVNFLGQAHFKEIGYELNPDYGLGKFLGASFWVFNAVLFEELVFRGALLYLLIRYLGAIRACLLSSVAFGVYHWFSYGVLGERWILMAYIFLVTGAGGWMFAYAYAKTRSLYAPTGLHLGWNLVTAIVFSSGPVGDQLLVQTGEEIAWSEWFTLAFFCLQTIVAPGLVTWYLVRFYRPVEADASAGSSQAAVGA